MENNKRKTLDAYFPSTTQKKSKPILSQSDDGNNQNVNLQPLDSYACHLTNDEPVEVSLMNKVSADVIDISHSCQDSPAQPKLATYPKIKKTDHL
ncbi:unnamed protein product [Rotaria sp. Silwood2]|nr:unnamed protein product [Rotaria sp. Silwood2]